MYDIADKQTRAEVARNLEQAKVLVENAIRWLEFAKAVEPSEVYLGYDMDDRIYNCRVLARSIGEHVKETKAD